MSAVATETTCLGETSMYSIWLARASRERVAGSATGSRSSTKWPSSSSGAFAWATTCSSSSSAGRYSISSVTIGRIGKAWAFCFFSSAMAAAVNGWPAFRTTSPALVTRSGRPRSRVSPDRPRRRSA